MTLIVDNPQQVAHLERFAQTSENAWPGSINVLIKIDTGYHRAGVSTDSSAIGKIVAAASDRCSIVGIYSHLGHSYSSNSPREALAFLKTELTEAVEGANAVKSHISKAGAKDPGANFLITIGATPTATATQTALATDEGREVLDLIASIKKNFDFEIHAGVYPVLDMQQLGKDFIS